MTFDSSYSETVSLSRILDCFILDGERPSVILSFLSKYTELEVMDIFSHSLYLPRMLCLGFAYGCSEEELKKLISYASVECVHRMDWEECRIRAYFLWQILKSTLGNSVKDVARKAVLDIVSKVENSWHIRFKHPYSGLVGRKMQGYDSLFLENPTEEDWIISAIGKMDIGDFSEYLENLPYSLWFMRMFQIDVFSILDIQRKYVFIKKTFMDKRNTMSFQKIYIGFYKQLMVSSEDIEIKKMVYESMRKVDIAEDYLMNNDTGTYDMIHSGLSSEEMMMRMQLFGMDAYAESIVTYYLLKGDMDMLKWMYENSPEIIRESLDVTDFIAHWISQDGE